MPVACNAGGALCAGRSALQEGAARGPTSASNTMQACTRVGVIGAPRIARPCHKNATTNTPGTTKSHSRGPGRGAARLLGAGDTVPECTVRPAATTGGVPVKCSPQSALPYVLTTRFHANLTVSETGELPATFGADIHSTSQKIWC